jgi:hypothetical protein
MPIGYDTRWGHVDGYPKKPVSQLSDTELYEEWRKWLEFAACNPDALAPERMLEVSREVIRRERA